jgi:hypothetical protein
MGNGRPSLTWPERTGTVFMGCVVLSVMVPAAAGAMVTDLALALRGGVLAPSAPGQGGGPSMDEERQLGNGHTNACRRMAKSCMEPSYLVHMLSGPPVPVRLLRDPSLGSVPVPSISPLS